MFKIFFINFGYSASKAGETLEEAKKIARKAGFESRIETEDGTCVGTWSPISGYVPWGSYRY
jgi:hypothetical protein